MRPALRRGPGRCSPTPIVSAPARRGRSRRGRALALALAVVLVAAAVAWRRSRRGGCATCSVTPSAPPAALVAGALPAGRLLVSSAHGTWIVRGDGTRLRLGPWTAATWSPRGLYVAAWRGRELSAVAPERARGVDDRGARAGPRRHVVARRLPDRLSPRRRAGGRRRRRDGRTRPRPARAARRRPRGARARRTRWPGWPRAGRVEVRDVDTGALVWRSAATVGAASALAWSADGHRLLARGDRRLTVLDVTRQPRLARAASRAALGSARSRGRPAAIGWRWRSARPRGRSDPGHDARRGCRGGRSSRRPARCARSPGRPTAGACSCAAPRPTNGSCSPPPPPTPPSPPSPASRGASAARRPCRAGAAPELNCNEQRATRALLAVPAWAAWKVNDDLVPRIMRGRRRHARALAERQHGVVARGSSRRSGSRASAVCGARAGGAAASRSTAASTPSGTPLLTVDGRRMAAVLAAGPGAVLSHASAAALWEIRPTSATRIDVTVRSDGGRAAAGPAHPPNADAPRRRDHRAPGIPVTTPARTLLDLASSLPRRALERALDEAEIQRALRPRALERSHEPTQASAERPRCSERSTTTATPPSPTPSSRSCLLALCDDHAPRPSHARGSPASSRLPLRRQQPRRGDRRLPLPPHPPRLRARPRARRDPRPRRLPHPQVHPPPATREPGVVAATITKVGDSVGNQ